LKSDKTLKISGYDKEELLAKTKTKIAGGKSEEVKVVAEEDKTALSGELTPLITKKVEESIKSKIGSSQKLVEGSIKIASVSEKF